MRMNLLIIFADQMHRYALGKMNPQVHTPNLDRLCEEGVLFTKAYSNNPICTPFRGNLFTGLYSSHNKVIFNGDAIPENLPTMAGMFNQAGYQTSYAGKWHLGGIGNNPVPEEIRAGFRHFIGYQCHNGFKEDVVFFDEENKEHHFDKHRTVVETDLTLQRLEMLNKTKDPFLHVLSYQAPHYPVQPSEEFEKFYENVTFSQTPDFVDVDPYTPTFSPLSPRPYENDPDYQRYGKNMQEYLRLYYSMVTELDYGVGRILDKLEQLGIRDETIVIFTSDHGDMQGSHGYKNKCLPFEKSCGIPMIISVPKGKKGEISDALVSGVDILPTILSLCGISWDTHFDGQSIADYLLGKVENVAEKPVIAESSADGVFWRMIRKGDFKLTYNWDARKPMYLFDLKEDPFEMNNLVDKPEYSEVIEELYRLMEKATPFE